MSKKRFGILNKRGQPEGIGLGTLLAIVLGGLAVILLIIGFTSGFGFIFGKIKVLPGQSFDAVILSCEGSLSIGASARAGYCNNFKEVEINGEEQFVTCEWLAEAPRNYLEDIEGGCGALSGDALVYCDSKGLDDDEIVNGKTCGDLRELTCQDIKNSDGIGALWQGSSCDSASTDETDRVTKDKPEEGFCCLAKLAA